MTKILFTLLTILVMASCEKGTGIKPGDSSDKSIILYADEIQRDNAVSFNAPQSWSATVSESSDSDNNTIVEWLQLSSYSGNAGLQTLSLSMMANFTGQSRTAEIKIISGVTIIKITVEQKSTTSDNKAPQYKTIKRINSFYNGAPSGYVDFTYDNQQRVTAVKVLREGYSVFYTIAYSVSNIVIGIDSEVNMTMTLDLDSNGKVISGTTAGSGLEAAAYVYDKDNHLLSYPSSIYTSPTPTGNEVTKVQLFSYNVWEGLNIKSTVKQNSPSGTYDEESNYEYSDRLNTGLTSIDITGGFIRGPEFIFLKEGSFGKKLRNLIKRETGTYTRDWSYDFDKDGNLTRFSIASSGGGDIWTESHELIYN